MTNSRAGLKIFTIILMCAFAENIFLNAFTIKSYADDHPLLLEQIKLPPGFKIDIYAYPVPNARAMAMSSKGILFVGSMRAGRVYALVDADHDNRAERIFVIAEGLNMPVGVSFSRGSLYVSAVHRILRYDNIESRLDNPPEAVVVTDGFPEDAHHGWKFIRFGPDGKLYVPVGAPCNVCARKDPRYASIMRIEPDGTQPEVFAHGIRNSVGFDWHPDTKELWFTDNGRDWLGDDMPPDELNSAPKEGMHFGFPYKHGKNIIDPDFGSGAPAIEFTPPKQELGAHVAALGMRFYTGRMFPREYHNGIFIAEHGSWNRSTPAGYRITYLELRDNRVVDYRVFAEGWLTDEGVWGRPADVLIAPDGALLVSDDHAGAIYRISRIP